MRKLIGLRTALLLLGRQMDEAPLLPARSEKPEVNGDFLIRRGNNPRKQRKGKSGEITRTGGK